MVGTFLEVRQSHPSHATSTVWLHSSHWQDPGRYDRRPRPCLLLRHHISAVIVIQSKALVRLPHPRIFASPSAWCQPSAQHPWGISRSAAGRQPGNRSAVSRRCNHRRIGSCRHTALSFKFVPSRFPRFPRFSRLVVGSETRGQHIMDRLQNKPTLSVTPDTEARSKKRSRAETDASPTDATAQTTLSGPKTAEMRPIAGQVPQASVRNTASPSRGASLEQPASSATGRPSTSANDSASIFSLPDSTSSESFPPSTSAASFSTGPRGSLSPP